MFRARTFSGRNGGRSVPRAFGILASVVVVLGLIAGALHHHAPNESAQHPCALCSVHHAPATPVAVVEPTPPAPTYERVPVVTVAAPRTTVVVSAPTRAPPIA